MIESVRILIVEDEPKLRSFFEEILSGDGYLVKVVGTVRHARYVVRNGEFEILISDMSLPDGDGPDLIRDIHAEYPHIKILAISGGMLKGMAHLAWSAGASASLLKPITSTELRYCVYELIDPTCSWSGQ